MNWIIINPLKPAEEPQQLRVRTVAQGLALILFSFLALSLLLFLRSWLDPRATLWEFLRNFNLLIINIPLLLLSISIIFPGQSALQLRAYILQQTPVDRPLRCAHTLAVLVLTNIVLLAVYLSRTLQPTPVELAFESAMQLAYAGSTQADFALDSLWRYRPLAVTWTDPTKRLNDYETSLVEMGKKTNEIVKEAMEYNHDAEYWNGCAKYLSDWKGHFGKENFHQLVAGSIVDRNLGNFPAALEKLERAEKMAFTTNRMAVVKTYQIITIQASPRPAGAEGIMHEMRIGGLRPAPSPLGYVAYKYEHSALCQNEGYRGKPLVTWWLDNYYGLYCVMKPDTAAAHDAWCVLLWHSRYDDLGGEPTGHKLPLPYKIALANLTEFNLNQTLRCAPHSDKWNSNQRAAESFNKLLFEDDPLFFYGRVQAIQLKVSRGELDDAMARTRKLITLFPPPAAGVGPLNKDATRAEFNEVLLRWVVLQKFLQRPQWKAGVRDELQTAFAALDAADVARRCQVRLATCSASYGQADGLASYFYEQGRRFESLAGATGSSVRSYDFFRAAQRCLPHSAELRSLIGQALAASE